MFPEPNKLYVASMDIKQHGGGGGDISSSHSFEYCARNLGTQPKMIHGVLWNWNCSLSYTSQYKSMLSTSIMVVSYDVSLFVWSFLVKNGCATLRSQIIVMDALGNIVQYSSVYIYRCYESKLNYWWKGKRNEHKSVHEASKAVSLEGGLLSSLSNQKFCTVSAQNREMLHRAVYAQDREMRYRRHSKQRNAVLSVLKKREMLDCVLYRIKLCAVVPQNRKMM